MEKIRALVIDDSAFMRKMISEILNSDDRLKVIGIARNGEVGINKVKELSPDVVIMDVNMPVMDGFTALQQIMHICPLPVIMLSGETTDGANKTIKAIENGAVDFIKKPSGPISLNIEIIKEELIHKVVIASKVSVSSFSQKKDREDVHILEKELIDSNPKYMQHERTIIAIGTSTGGPRALQQVLTDLPANFNIPILIIQHMPAGFTKSLADRLDALVDFHVKEAVHGEILQNGTVYIAPGDYHMTVEKVGTAFVIKLSRNKHVNGHRPSVDVLFESLSRLERVNKIAVVLTGMGNDGSKGITILKQNDRNAFVIGETEETSIIYGMPKAAFETGQVDKVLPLHQIGLLLSEFKTP